MSPLPCVAETPSVRLTHLACPERAIVAGIVGAVVQIVGGSANVASHGALVLNAPVHVAVRVAQAPVDHVRFPRRPPHSQRGRVLDGVDVVIYGNLISTFIFWKCQSCPFRSGIDSIRHKCGYKLHLHFFNFFIFKL